ncbi:MAG TPA: hypothetical protein V6D20_11405 [Candidatus Obscuribacterales bacterium]
MGKPVGLGGVDEPERTDRLLRIPAPQVRGSDQLCTSAVGQTVKMPVDVSFAGNGNILGGRMKQETLRSDLGNPVLCPLGVLAGQCHIVYFGE